MIWMSLIFIAGLAHQSRNDMAAQWCAALFLYSCYLSFLVFKKTGTIPAVTLFYFLLNSVIAFNYPDPRFANNPALGSLLSTGTLFSMLSLAIVTTFMLQATKETFRQIKFIIPITTIANSIYVLLGAVSHAAYLCMIYHRELPWLENIYNSISAIVGPGVLPQGVGVSGFLNYAGMNGVLICFGIPFLNYKTKWGRVFVATSILAVILSGSSIPYGVAFVMAIAYLVAKRGYNNKFTWVVPAAVASVAFATERGHLFNSAYRFQAYKLFTKAWVKDASWLIGSGPGSFQSLAPIVQIKNNFMIDMTGKTNSYFWLWAHSDWLQGLLENGIIGLVLVTLLAADVIIRIYKKRDAQLLALACGMCSAAIFDFPLRYFIFSFLTAFIVAAAYA